MNDRDEDREDDDEAPDFEVYDVDEDTRNLIEIACNCLISLAQAQVNEESGANLVAIAEALAERFAIDSIELEEHHHISEEGEEVILAPKGGVFPDSPEEGEAPAVTP